MGCRCVLFGRRTEGDVAFDDDKRRSVVTPLEIFQRTIQRLLIVGIGNMQDIPAVSFEAFADIFGQRQAGAAFDGNPVAVVKPAKIIKLEMAGERRRFAANPFHHVAVAAQRINIEVEKLKAWPVEITGEPLRCDRHADAVGDALAERSRGGFDSRGQTEFRMTGGFAVELTKLFEIVEGQRRMIEPLVRRVQRAHTGEMERRIEQHGRVADG